MKRIMVTGATGQIGSALTAALRSRCGDTNVVAVGHRNSPPPEILQAGYYLSLDVTDPAPLAAAVREYNIGTIFHLAAVLSAKASRNPLFAWNVNMKGLLNVLEAARKNGCALFFPSSIGVFGPATPKDQTPQETVLRPSTIYGITKVAGELLCDYYHREFGVDTRGLRYPGLISYETPPGGGTTDYAVEIFYSAIQHQRYTCFLQKNTRLDMMYMADAVRAAIELMEADSKTLIHRNAYNLGAMSFTPEELAREIRKHFPHFEVEYCTDPLRQAIADSWPNQIDDTAARTEWSWAPEYDLSTTVREMIKHLRFRLFAQNNRQACL